MRSGIYDVSMSSFMERGVLDGVGILSSVVPMLGKHPSPNRHMFLVGVGWVFDLEALMYASACRFLMTDLWAPIYRHDPLNSGLFEFSISVGVFMSNMRLLNVRLGGFGSLKGAVGTPVRR